MIRESIVCLLSRKRSDYTFHCVSTYAFCVNCNSDMGIELDEHLIKTWAQLHKT